MESRDNYLKGVTADTTKEERRVIEIVSRKFTEWRYVDFDRVYIVKQDEREYLALREQASEENSDLCKCLKYRNITRYPESEWTVYVPESVCGNGTDCHPNKPEECNTSTQDTHGFLFGLPGLVLAAFLVLGSVLVFRRAENWFLALGTQFAVTPMVLRT